MMDLELGGCARRNQADGSAMVVDAINYAVRIVGNGEECKFQRFPLASQHRPQNPVRPHGELRVQEAQNLRQHIWPDEAKGIMSGVADIFEKEGREIQRIAQEGTNDEKERLNHDIVHGPPEKMIAS